MVITVVLADDHELAREGVRKLLADAPDIQILGLAVDGETAQQLVAQLRPQVLLLDLVMPGPSPADIALWVNIHHPETAVLVLTGHDRDYYLAQMLRRSAGTWTKGAGPAVDRGDSRGSGGERVFTREQQQRCRRGRRRCRRVGKSDRAEQEV
jgi:DNA-binding NarL/FixJ family response regulator